MSGSEESAPGNRGMGERADPIGYCENGSLSVTLTNPKVLDCPLCWEPLTIPIYQCNNGHVACSFCCTRLPNICHYCPSPIGYNRNVALEKVLESVKVQCPNASYGCKETTTYNKKNDHYETCNYAPCFCPILDCCFVGSSSQLYQHFRCKHKNSAIQFQYNRDFVFNIYVDTKFLLLQEEKDGILLILNNRNKSWANALSICCITQTSKKCCLKYTILIEDEFNSIIKFQSCTKSIQKRTDRNPCLTESFFLVPSDLLPCQLTIRIWGFGPDLH